MSGHTAHHPHPERVTEQRVTAELTDGRAVVLGLPHADVALAEQLYTHMWDDLLSRIITAEPAWWYGLPAVRDGLQRGLRMHDDTPGATR